ncbi:MAG: porin [Desulfovibrionaceae bacterium]|jgi:predicted porin|nr:porin [Desulfovibrionaceae bacterium]
MKNFGNIKVCVIGALAAGTGTIASFAYAQSSVTMYGIADGGMGYTTNATNTNDQNHSAVHMVSGGQANDRWGLKGTEDLGGGLKTVFQLENGFSLATGALQQGGRIFGRQAFVGIKSPYGAFTFGRQKVPLFDFFYDLDPLTYSNWSLSVYDSQFANRADNSVKYMGHAGPLTFDLLYSAGYDTTVVDTTGVSIDSRVGQEISGGILYSAGTALAALVYDMRHGATMATKGNTEQRLAFGASYEFTPSVKGYGGYRWFNSSVPTTAGRSDMYYGGVQFRVSQALFITGAVYYTNIKSAKQHPVAFGIQSKYYLSKVTSLYTQVSYAKNSNGSNLGVAGYGTGVVAGKNQTGIEIGVMHQF